MGFEAFTDLVIGSTKGTGSGMKSIGLGMASFFNMFRK